MTRISHTETRAGQLFHNFLDIMVKCEHYPEVSAQFNAMLTAVEEECLRDHEGRPDDDVERTWLEMVRALREFLNAVVDDHKGQKRPKLTVLTFKDRND